MASKKALNVLVTSGASNITDKARAEADFYATEPRAVELLLAEEKFTDTVYEPACGAGHISEVLLKHGYRVISEDLVERGYGISGRDFMTCRYKSLDYDIVTNPPYSLALEFVEKALEVVAPGRKVAMFLRLQFLEGKKRKQLFLDNPPRTVYISSSRLHCGRNGIFDKGSNAMAFCWIVWEKGYNGKTYIKWIN